MKKEMKTKPPVTPREPEEDSSAGKNGVQYVSWEEHLEIEDKLFALHGELFRKLAEHDRQR